MLIGAGTGSSFVKSSQETVAQCELRAFVQFENIKNQLNTVKGLSQLGCTTLSLAIAVAGFAESAGLSVGVGAGVETICLSAVDQKYNEAMSKATIDHKANENACSE